MWQLWKSLYMFLRYCSKTSLVIRTLGQVHYFCSTLLKTPHWSGNIAFVFFVFVCLVPRLSIPDLPFSFHSMFLSITSLPLSLFLPLTLPQRPFAWKFATEEERNKDTNPKGKKEGGGRVGEREGERGKNLLTFVSNPLYVMWIALKHRAWCNT